MPQNRIHRSRRRAGTAPVSYSPSDVTDDFVYLATEVSNRFPELDLRFNLQSGTNLLRYSAPAISPATFELILGQTQVATLVHQAIFQIKETGKLFDS